MISEERKDELIFLIQTDTPIRMTDSTSDDRLMQTVPHTNITIDYSDMYTLRDLFETDIISFGQLLTDDDGTQLIETTFHTDVRVINDESELMCMDAGETINIGIEHEIIEELRNHSIIG